MRITHGWNCRPRSAILHLAQIILCHISAEPEENLGRGTLFPRPGVQLKNAELPIFKTARKLGLGGRRIR